MADTRPIGVLDSGMGGLSVLRTLIRELPGERFLYWGDNLHAPYGVREPEELKGLIWDIVNRLLDSDVKAIVIACNTATSAAAADLRSKLTIPVLGLEPALKPAAEFAGDGCVAVLATEATLHLEKYQSLLNRFGRNTVNLPCPELVEFVEAGDLGSEKLLACLHSKLDPLKGELKAVVLGCTHYVWLRPAVRSVVGEQVGVFDGNDGIARHLKHVLEERNLLSCAETGGYCMETTSPDPIVRQRMLDLMNLTVKDETRV